MSLRGLTSTYELQTAATPPRSSRTGDLPHVSVEGYSGGDWHSIIDYFIDDNRLEDEFFGRRTLSLGDFDGTREIASPTRRPQERMKNSASHGIEALLMPASANDCETILRYYEWDNGSTPNEATLVAENGTVMWFGDKENIRADHSYMLSEQLEALIEPCCALDSGLQIKSAGPLDTPLITPDNITERALVPSIRGEISKASTPELTRDGCDAGNLELAAPGFDASPASLHFFSQAGVHVTTRELQDDFVAAQVSRLAGGRLDIDQTSQIEKDRVTAEFFGLSRSKTTSSCLEAASPTDTVRVHRTKQKDAASASQQFLLPAVYDDLADEDYYLGSGVKIPDIGPYLATSQSTPNTEGNMLPAALRFPLRRSRESQHNEIAAPVCESPDTASTVQGIAPNQLFVPDCKQPVAQRVTNARYNGLDLTIAEAPFRNSTLMQRRIDRTKDIRKRKADDHESTYSSKRARLTFLKKHSNQIKAHASYLTEARSITSVCGPSTTSSKSSLNSHLLTSPMPQALKGFTGQFILHVPNQLFCAQGPIRQSFGDRTHPNGLIINTRFHPDNRHSRTDLTESDIHHDNALVLVVQHCEAQSVLASSMFMHAKRSADENALRREAHRECTSARLEGVSVGYYRYYLGHMTVEEYVEAGLCVCWERCFCNKFCTRFGDLRCPCAGDLVMVE